MKKAKIILTAFALVGSTICLFAANEPSPIAKTSIESNKKLAIYQYYNASYKITIDYNPATGTVARAAYDTIYDGRISSWDRTGAGISHEQGSNTIYLDNYQVYSPDYGWLSLNGEFTQI